MLKAFYGNEAWRSDKPGVPEAAHWLAAMDVGAIEVFKRRDLLFFKPSSFVRLSVVDSVF